MSQSGLAMCCTSVSGTPRRPPPPPPSHCRRRLPLHNIMTVLTSCCTSHIFFSSATPPSPTIPPTTSHLPTLLPMGTLPGQCNKEQEDGDTGWRLRGQSATCRHYHTFLKVGQKHHRAADRRSPHDIPIFSCSGVQHHKEIPPYFSTLPQFLTPPTVKINTCLLSGAPELRFVHITSANQEWIWSVCRHVCTRAWACVCVYVWGNKGVTQPRYTVSTGIFFFILHYPLFVCRLAACVCALLCVCAELEMAALS